MDHARPRGTALAVLGGRIASPGKPLGQLPGQLRAKTYLLFPWLDDLARHEAMLDAVEGLIGAGLLGYHTRG